MCCSASDEVPTDGDWALLANGEVYRLRTGQNPSPTDNAWLLPIPA
jgi:hypothetical protein